MNQSNIKIEDIKMNALYLTHSAYDDYSNPDMPEPRDDDWDDDWEDDDWDDNQY